MAAIILLYIDESYVYLTRISAIPEARIAHRAISWMFIIRS